MDYALSCKCYIKQTYIWLRGGTISGFIWKKPLSLALQVPTSKPKVLISYLDLLQVVYLRAFKKQTNLEGLISNCTGLQSDENQLTINATH
jgi:hypothetical protein